MNARAFAWFGLMLGPAKFDKIRRLLPPATAEAVSKEVEAEKEIPAEELLDRLRRLREDELVARRATVPGANRLPHPLLRQVLASKGRPKPCS